MDTLRPRQRSNLTAFMLASVALHAVLLAYGQRDSSPVEAGVDRELLAVRLDGLTDTAHSRVVPPATSAQSVYTMPESAAQAIAHRDTVSVDTITYGVQDQNQDAASRVRARVISDFARYFYYPAMARQRGWEGRVLLAFRVEQDGLLHDPRVVHTSGFGILDAAALNSLRKVERIADAGGARHDLQIPVVYRLTEAR